MYKFSSKSNGSSLETEIKYKALSCDIRHVEPNSHEYDQIKDIVLKKDDQEMKNGKLIQISNIFKIKREVEHQRFNAMLNIKKVFHGSRIGKYSISIESPSLEENL
jgi:hypothetical protein